MRISLGFKGVDKMQKALAKRELDVLKAVKAGVYLAANNIMTESKRQVPVDQGVLRGSGYVALPVEQQGRVTVELGYGGPAADYAAIQHEVPMNHPEGGKDHFLSDPINAAEGSFKRTVTEFAARALAGGRVGMPAGGHPTTPDDGGAPGSGGPGGGA